MGRELRLPVDLVITRPPDADLPSNSTEFVKRLKGHIDGVQHEVRHCLKIAADAMKTRHDAKANDTTFSVGEAVRLYNPRRMKAKSPKLMSDWEGPYEVIHRLSNVTYRIRKVQGVPKFVLTLYLRLKQNTLRFDIIMTTQYVPHFMGYHMNTRCGMPPAEFRNVAGLK